MAAPSVEARLAALEAQVAWNSAHISPKPAGWKPGDPIPNGTAATASTPAPEA